MTFLSPISPGLVLSAPCLALLWLPHTSITPRWDPISYLRVTTSSLPVPDLYYVTGCGPGLCSAPRFSPPLRTSSVVLSVIVASRWCWITTPPAQRLRSSPTGDDGGRSGRMGRGVLIVWATVALAFASGGALARTAARDEPGGERGRLLRRGRRIRRADLPRAGTQRRLGAQAPPLRRISVLGAWER